MIFAIIFLITLLICTALEYLVKSRAIRAGSVLLLVLVSFGVALNQGIALGKSDQQNRFSRLLPRVLTILNMARSTSKNYESASKSIADIFNSTADFNFIERKVAELEVMVESGDRPNESGVTPTPKK